MTTFSQAGSAAGYSPAQCASRRPGRKDQSRPGPGALAQASDPRSMLGALSVTETWLGTSPEMTSDGDWPTRSIGTGRGYSPLLDRVCRINSRNPYRYRQGKRQDQGRNTFYKISQNRDHRCPWLDSPSLCVLRAGGVKHAVQPVERLGCDFCRAIKSQEDIFQPLRIQAADHTPAMRDRDRAGFFRNHHSNRISRLRNPQRGAVAQAHLAFWGAVENAGRRKRHHTRTRRRSGYPR